MTGTGDSRFTQSPWPAVAALGRRRERSDERKERYRQAKATKCGGKGGRESECLVLPLKPGN
jgi:hypothetical protein